jgi:Ni,Fe-hydrogenase III large subunit
VAYAQACEEALGLSATDELARARTILLELERGWSHLNDVAAVCAGVGLAAGNTRFAGLCERMRRLNAVLAGHRFLFGTVEVGGSSWEVDAAAAQHARRELQAVGAATRGAWRELQFNSSFQDRLPEIGVVDAADAARLGTVGPAARAAGVAADVRSTARGLAYGGFEPVMPERAEGDVQARLEQRGLELWQSLEILDALLDRPVRRATTEPDGDGAALGVGRVESPRGATLCVIERTDDHLDRVRLRTGSYANWPSVAHAAVDNLLPDFPLINKSFELCYACADR